MTFIMRPMQLEDIPQVLAIDEMSFPTPWSARTYKFEVANRDTSHFVVLETASQARQQNGLHALLQRLRRAKGLSSLVGYGGCWLIAGEAHISTIAVHPDFRGRNLGELLLAAMLQRSIELGGKYSVLEVRISNTLAQALYKKYEYEIVGRRRGYYRDNGEDAFLMETRPLDEEYAQRLHERVVVLRQKIDYIDKFTAQE
jgi:[ribosomal protein S18]-alanine N-acetyltransferase